MSGPRPGPGTILAASFVALGLSAGPSAANADAGDAPATTELYYELKLQLRGRMLLKRVALDQWAGGRLWMEVGPSNRLELIRPIEDPWTFRWYPTKDEVKLGAAVWVPQPDGDVFGSLAARLEPLARERYRRWWDDDRVEATAPRRPPWVGLADGFWAAQHRREENERDPLHAEPVYPFHVLGDPAGRFAVELDASGAPVAGSVVDRMSEPWLPDGWNGWLAGRPRNGYGYWASERPDWEPRTYQTFARTVELLSWPARPDAVGPAPDLPRLAAEVVKALAPRARNHVAWSGIPEIAFGVVGRTAERTEIVGQSERRAIDGEPEIGYRIWRYVRRDGDGRIEQDELQLLLDHEDGKSVKLWIKIGRRPHGGAD